MTWAMRSHRLSARFSIQRLRKARRDPIPCDGRGRRAIGGSGVGELGARARRSGSAGRIRKNVSLATLVFGIDILVMINEGTPSTETRH
jgi:hypothetical protein